MPIISRFYGIAIKMYFQQAEHNPPHVHATYGDYVAEVAVVSGEVLDGYLPPKILSMVIEWISINREDLLEMWDTQCFKSLAPLE